MRHRENGVVRVDGRRGAARGSRMNRAGTSLVELVVAVAILGGGVVAVASLTATAARTLVRAGSIDEAHVLLQRFVDSTTTAPARVPGSGRWVHPAGVLAWSVPSAPGAYAWARFEHLALPAPIRIDFVVPAWPP